jgi:3',5'-cyclic AMP phosphodiesterase CpdA
VLSDLHVGDAARSADLSLPRSAGGKPTGYVDEFRTFVADQKLRADLLLFAGDITDSAHPVEFQLAGGAVQTLAATFGLSLDRDVALVPGNHDVNWKSLSQYPDDITRYSAESRYYPIRYHSWPFDPMLRDGHRHLCEPPYFTIRETTRAIIVGLNSSAHDGPLDDPDKPHYGLAPNDSLIALDTHLSELEYDPAVLRVFLVHHHVVPRDDRARNHHDPSLLVNAAELLDILGKHRFDIVVHGHKHVPAVSTHVTSSNFPLLVVGAGSFSAMIDPRNAGPIQNSFHEIQVDGRHRVDGTVMGRVRSWAYVFPEGWQAGEHVLGIEHVVPYGCYESPAALLMRAQAVIDARLRAGADHVLWTQVISALPELAYLNVDATAQLVQDACATRGLVQIGEAPKLVLIRP